jgi:hypothetical protein
MIDRNASETDPFGAIADTSSWKRSGRAETGYNRRQALVR